MIDAHKSFWERKIGSENLEKSFKKVRSKEHVLDYSNNEQEKLQRIPDLELYIVNLFSPKERYTDTGVDAVPLDLDGVNDRNLDIKLSDG